MQFVGVADGGLRFGALEHVALGGEGAGELDGVVALLIGNSIVSMSGLLAHSRTIRGVGRERRFRYRYTISKPVMRLVPEEKESTSMPSRCNIDTYKLVRG